ncbi:hypothetical protein BC835DRAFT_1417729 [Cytidiella melzeri]|nr:hypothetical protein BC835DRAFT_1417729 [Cytidiella melzeri]
MVLRIPKTIGDKSLLEDEPFKSHFSGEHSFKKLTRSGRNVLYSTIEKTMRETDGGLQAACYWLKTVLGPGADVNSTNIHEFIHFFWLLNYEGHTPRVDSVLMNLCRIHKRDPRCIVTDPIWMVNIPPEREEPLLQPKQCKSNQDVPENDAEGEHNGVQTHAIVGEASLQPITTSLQAHQSPIPAQSAPATAGNSKLRLKKRKAKKAEPSINNTSSSEEISLAIVQPASPLSACIDSDSLTPLPSDSEEVQSAPPQVPSFSVPLRANPIRPASHRQRLDTMGRESLYQEGTADDESNCPSISKLTTFAKTGSANMKQRKARKKPRASSSVASEYALIVKPVTFAKTGTAGGKQREARNKLRGKSSAASTALNPLVDSIVIAPTIASIAQTLDVTSVPPPPQPKSALARRTFAPSHRIRLAALKTRNVENPAFVAPRPIKKRQLIAAGELSSAMLGHDLYGVSVANDYGLSSGQSRQTRSHTKAATISSVSTAPVPKFVEDRRGKSKATKRGKRTRDEAEDDTISLSTNIPPMQKEGRRLVALPKTRRKQVRATQTAMPAVPQNTLGVSASAVDTIIRDGATNAMEILRCPDEAVDEWEMEDPSGQFALDESDDETFVGAIDVSHEHSICAPKLPLPSYPPIWSQSRQEVCESFARFRSYQGGVYFRKDRVEGYLLGGFSARRDIFHNGGKLIISHGGGKAESIRKTDGHLQTFEASDQLEEDKSVWALLQTYKQKQPIALLIDDKYALFPYDLASKGCAYAVLGWYYIAYAWSEYQAATNSDGKVVRYKFAFQWADGQGEPWWHQFGSAELIDQGIIAPLTSTNTDIALPDLEIPQEISSRGHDPELCESCNNSSPQVYEQGWMCLKPGCKSFWTFRDKKRVPERLEYAKSFLQPVSGFGQQVVDIRPPPPVSLEDATGSTTSWHFCKGWHCTQCGRLSSRYKWEGWECRTCGNVFRYPAKHWLPMHFRFQAHAKTFDRHQIEPASGITCARYQIFACEKSHAQHIMLILPRSRGRIHMLLAPNLASTAADNILQEYQVQADSGALKLRRWPLRAHKCRGTLLTNYFSQNTGEPYQYVGGTDNTVPWENAPSAVKHALDLIKLRMSQAKLACRADFNEVLSAAYMERQKMAFHSDSEKGLGPVVASLSLGASAYMYFRLHSKFAASELAPGSSREVLQLYLRHGDVLVMEGADVQTYYEHTVVPTNFRIAATARSIMSGDR